MNIPAHFDAQSTSDTTPIERGVPIGHPAAGDWPRHAPRSSSAVLLASSVARISDSELQRMDRSDLIDVARCASSALPRQEYLSHLPYMTHEQLWRLACLARRSCRLQMQPGVPLE